jgi:hypothetical protein
MTNSAAIESAGPALIHDARQSFVCPNRRVLKLPRLLTGWWCSLPLKLPGESCRKRSCNDAQGVLGELGILLGGFRESEAVQLRVDLNRLHATIIPSRVEAPSLPDTVRDVTSVARRRKPTIGPHFPQRRFVYRRAAQITIADYTASWIEIGNTRFPLKSDYVTDYSERLTASRPRHATLCTRRAGSVRQDHAFRSPTSDTLHDAC